MKTQELYTQIVQELQRSNPDQYAAILQRIGIKEPCLYETRLMPKIIDKLIEVSGADRESFFHRRWIRSAHNNRRVFLAVLLELYSPSILSVPHNNRATVPKKLSRPICLSVCLDQRNFYRSVAEVRFFYQTYSQFRTQVGGLLSALKKFVELAQTPHL